MATPKRDAKTSKQGLAKQSETTHRGKAVRRNATSPARPRENTDADGSDEREANIELWNRLERVLTIGSVGGSHDISRNTLTQPAINTIKRCLDFDGCRTVTRAVNITDSGHALTNEPAIIVLAMAAAHTNDEVRRQALANLSKVCRTGAHLFQFCEVVSKLRGWGGRSLLTRAVGNWYLNRSPMDLAHQVTTYTSLQVTTDPASRWTHRDILRKVRPQTKNAALNLVLRYAVTGRASVDPVAFRNDSAPKSADGKPLDVRRDHLIMKTASDKAVFAYLKAVESTYVKPEIAAVAKLIDKHKLQLEQIPRELLSKTEVWDSLLRHMPPLTMIRNLGKMTAVGLLHPSSQASAFVMESLLDASVLKAARLHPLTVMIALNEYALGRDSTSNGTWKPVRSICDALSKVFEECFKYLKPIGLDVLLACDVSPSMEFGNCSGAMITPELGIATMAMTLARAAREARIFGFGQKLEPIDVGADDSLQTVLRKMHAVTMGKTDLALPFIEAKECGWNVDCFVTMTDKVRPDVEQANLSKHLREYRTQFREDARSIICGMAGKTGAIADPKDRYSLDVAGFDSRFPELMATFCGSA